jgi:sporulation protein YlmC with PRC-barrel domain
MRLDLGNPVQCSDGAFGELADIVIDPTTGRVTHLVVQPHDHHDQARLVPVALAHAGEETGATVRLECTIAELDRLEPIQRTDYLRLGEFPIVDGDWNIGIQEVYALPYYGSFAPGGIATGMGPGDLDPHVTITYDRVPKGEVEVRRSSAVTSSDGDHLGHVDGFVVDGEDHVAHFVLEHGHLWGKREITIPIAAVDRIENDEVILSLSTDEVGALKSVGVHRW